MGGARSMIKFKSLAEVLLSEDATRRAITLGCAGAPSYVAAVCAAPLHPMRPVCAATGFGARYRDPRSGLPFASAKALAMIEEQAPPWTKGNGNAPYLEAIEALKRPGLVAGRSSRREER